MYTTPTFLNGFFFFLSIIYYPRLSDKRHSYGHSNADFEKRKKKLDTFKPESRKLDQTTRTLDFVKTVQGEVISSSFSEKLKNTPGKNKWLISILDFHHSSILMLKIIYKSVVTIFFYKRLKFILR